MVKRAIDPGQSVSVVLGLSVALLGGLEIPLSRFVACQVKSTKIVLGLSVALLGGLEIPFLCLDVIQALERFDVALQVLF